MSEPRTYHVEKLSRVSARSFGVDKLTERDIEAWVRVDTLETNAAAYKARDDWFAAAEREVGSYRLVEMTPYGGNFIEFAVKQTLTLEEVKRHALVAV